MTYGEKNKEISGPPSKLALQGCARRSRVPPLKSLFLPVGLDSVNKDGSSSFWF